MNGQCFNLESCKVIFRLDDITTKEYDLWMRYLQYNNLDFDDTDDFFETYQQLRVRVWTWIDINNNKHELLDINSWISDDEVGVITLDGKIILENTDQTLTWISYLVDRQFDNCLDLFYNIRRNLIDDKYLYGCDDDDVQELLEEFFSCENGSRALELEATAWRLHKYDITKNKMKL